MAYEAQSREAGTLGAKPELAKNVLSIKEYRAGTRHVGVARMQYGNAVERRVAEAIDADPDGLGSFLKHAGGPGRYDFVGVGSAQGYLFELTTPAGIPGHSTRWYGPYVDYVTYTRPQNFVTLPP